MLLSPTKQTYGLHKLQSTDGDLEEPYNAIPGVQSGDMIMRIKTLFLITLCLAIFFLISLFPKGAECQRSAAGKEARIIFLHHSTGELIWAGGVPEYFAKYNAQYEKNYRISKQYFPKGSPYPWQNYPYDYWNIWVNHAGNQPFMEEPTLEILTQQYDVIIFKHCYPVSDIKGDLREPDIESADKRVGNYKLQYKALREAMRSFPKTKFIVWTGAARVRNRISLGSAKLAKEFFEWVKNEWDEKNDNIFVWDFYELETEGDLYLKNEYANSITDSHPNPTFSKRVAPLLCRRIIDVIEGRGDTSKITGE